MYIKIRCIDKIIIICLYIDDLIYTSNSDALVNEFRKVMVDEFEMENLGIMNFFFGLEVKQCDLVLFLKKNMLMIFLRGLSYMVVILRKLPCVLTKSLLWMMEGERLMVNYIEVWLEVSLSHK